MEWHSGRKSNIGARLGHKVDACVKVKYETGGVIRVKCEIQNKDRGRIDGKTVRLCSVMQKLYQSIRH